MSKAEIINEEPNFEGVVPQTQEDQFFGKQTEIDNKIPDDLEVTIIDDQYREVGEKHGVLSVPSSLASGQYKDERSSSN